MFLQHRADGSGERIVTSASDLTAASACEFAFLRRVDARLGRDVVVPPDDDPMLRRAARLGDAHEARVLAAYRAEFGAAGLGTVGLGAAGPCASGLGVVEIERADSRDEAALIQAQEHTLAALRGGAAVVFQATFFDPAQAPAAGGAPEIGFIGYADFLRRSGDAYVVEDTKLARRAKVTALLQLAAYAEQLERLAVPVAAEVVLILGDRSRSRHRLADIAPVFRSRRDRLHAILRERVSAVGSDGTRAGASPIGWGDPSIVACGRCEVCEPEVQRTRDPLLIAGIRASQRERLREAGLTSLEAVAAALPDIEGGRLAVPGMSPAVAMRLAGQALAQVDASPGGSPPVRVIDPAALAALPEPDPGDLFFDFEGDPLFREAASDASGTAEHWGLDYLFGMVDAAEDFTPIWAHDLAEERRALERFLVFVAERRRQYPGMHIYHYAAYERTHLLSIAARHGVGEAEVDRLLREHVLVDLYPVVRRALRVGSRSYSIKKLEPLYMGDELRDESGVTNGAQSVSEYAEAAELRASSDTADREEAQRRLAAIADYNRYDCVSTLRLRDWLLRLAAEHGISPEPRDLPVGAGAVEGPGASGTSRFTGAPGDAGAAQEPEVALSPLARSLTRQASLVSDPRDRRVAALAACAIDYHQREHKSFWWAHFARLVDPIEDWADTRDVLVIDPRESRELEPWRPPQGRQRSHRRTLLLRGELAPGSTLSPGSEVFLVSDASPGLTRPADAAPGSRTARRVRIAERRGDGVVVVETRGLDEPLDRNLPIAITPGPPPHAGAQKTAIEEWGQALADAFARGATRADPVVDLLRREPPRLNGGAAVIAPSSAEALAAGGSEDRRMIGAVVETLRRLDRSALAVQGPPGTGKTFLAARVIRTLVERDGWRIGVVAQSHRVVENVLAGVVAAGLDPGLVGKVPQGGSLGEGDPVPPFTVLRAGGHAAFLEEHRAHGRGAVVGGTAWDFSNAARVPRRSLDLLVIDEAGQFSLAPTIAASVAAERLLLLGDPQQLPQVSQGSHPEPVDASALGWLLGEHDTLPDGAGYFLAETRRMRPELAEIVSELSYEGRLRAHPSAGEREVLGAGPPGLVWHPVTHAGNATSSVEEAGEVVRLARAALGATVREPGRPDRPLDADDLIVVAAYNAQVECVAAALAAAGLSGIRVGTVDRFQGQEAVIAIVTLAASSADEVPRGLDFLLMRNRLNVAISRAQWAAHLVASRDLGSGLPTSPEGIAALSGYLRLTERGTTAEGDGRVAWDA